MPPKAKEPALEIPALPQRIWKAKEMEAIQLDMNNPKVVQFTTKPPARFPGDYLAYCALLGLTPHPSIPRSGATPPETDDNKNIRTIEFKNTTVDTKTLSILLLSLRPCKAINTLNFFNAGLTSAHLKILEESLPLTSIQHLRIDYNPFNDNQAVLSFFRAVTGPTSKIVSLSLRGDSIGEAEAVVLAQGLEKSPTLQSLNLFDNHLGDGGAQALVESLQVNNQLGHLSLANNRLTSEVAHSLARLIEGGGGRGLQDLNLSTNNIDEEGVRHLLTAIKASKDQLVGTLKALSLHRNLMPPPPAASPTSANLTNMIHDLEPIHVTL